jgi:hypothetical protein
VGWISDARGAKDDSVATTGGELTARGQAGWHSGFQLCGHTDTVAGTYPHATNGFGIVFPHGFMAVALAGEQEWQLRPRLDAQRVWLRRIYTSNTANVGTALVLWSIDPQTTAAVGPFRFDLRSTSQDNFRSVYRTFHFAAFELHKPDRSVSVIPVDIEAEYPDGIGTDQNPTPPSSYLARLGTVDLDWPIGDDVRLSGALAGVFSSDPLTCATCLPVTGKLMASWSDGAGTWTAGAERSMHLAMDDTITIEDRASAAYARPMEHVTARAAAFAALTRTTADTRSVPTGGVSAGLDVRLPERVALSLDGELARSYYARLDGDPTPRPELAGVGTVRLHRDFVFNPTARR